MPRHPEVANSEDFYVHLELETEARTLSTRPPPLPSTAPITCGPIPATAAASSTTGPTVSASSTTSLRAGSSFVRRAREGARRIVAEQQLAGRRGPRLHPEAWQLLKASIRLDHVRRYGPDLDRDDPATLRTAASILRLVAGVLDAGWPWRPSPLVFATRARETMFSPDQRCR